MDTTFPEMRSFFSKMRSSFSKNEIYISKNEIDLSKNGIPKKWDGARRKYILNIKANILLKVLYLYCFIVVCIFYIHFMEQIVM